MNNSNSVYNPYLNFQKPVFTRANNDEKNIYQGQTKNQQTSQDNDLIFKQYMLPLQNHHNNEFYFGRKPQYTSRYDANKDSVNNRLQKFEKMSSFAYFPINNGQRNFDRILPQNTSSEDAIENNTLNKK